MIRKILLALFLLAFPKVVFAQAPLFCTPTGGPDNRGLNTAIGCIPVNDLNRLIGFFLRWAFGIGGGIAFLLILYAAFQIMTSSGNPEKVKAGQELLGSAIGGIILLIFAVFVLEFIGVDLLNIPGFGGP